MTVGAMALTLVLDAVMLADVEPGPGRAPGWLGSPSGIVMVVDRLLRAHARRVVGRASPVLVYTVSEGVAGRRTTEGPVSIFCPASCSWPCCPTRSWQGGLFNLYVGFEILLTASYVLLTMGGTRQPSGR
ncbi:hypothetical protein QJS66_17920 [Kocuria rhizophila]|nr:hypothetical protein QJS66_17920 [Kocuria rhizophila]